jgi:two-component system response regulator GlrR
MLGAMRSDQLVVHVVAGPSRGQQFVRAAGRDPTVWRVGRSPDVELAIPDPSLEMLHCAIHQEQGRLRIVDLGGRGVAVDGVRVRDAVPLDGSLVAVGATVFRLALRSGSDPLDQEDVELSAGARFGSLVGQSAAIRRAFWLLERAAESDATVLLLGETGTGKEGAARGLHELGPRRGRPFVTVDCSAIPEALLESELFGHERGAFSGALAQRAGAFEEADGGTVFLDEVGELPLSLQPKLLRALEARTIRRIGSNRHRAVDVRIIAATNRDPRAMVDAQSFRADLYHRLSVLQVALPPLRARVGDHDLLARHFLAQLGSEPAVHSRLYNPAFFASLEGYSWPGNARELRNYLERCVLLGRPLALPASDPEAPPLGDLTGSYGAARAALLDWFEQRFVLRVLTQHDGNIPRAARAAGMHRAHLWRIVRRLRSRGALEGVGHDRL